MERAERFGRKLRELRLQNGLSLQKAAGAAGISRYRLDELEKGRSRATGHTTRPSRETVKSLAQVYGVPADMLLDLAGYAREHPLLSPEDSLLIDLFHSLDTKQQRMILRMLKAAPGP